MIDNQIAQIESTNPADKGSFRFTLASVAGELAAKLLFHIYKEILPIEIADNDTLSRVGRINAKISSQFVDYHYISQPRLFFRYIWLS